MYVKIFIPKQLGVWAAELDMEILGNSSQKHALAHLLQVFQNILLNAEITLLYQVQIPGFFQAAKTHFQGELYTKTKVSAAHFITR